jgi:hypothetical protein
MATRRPTRKRASRRSPADLHLTSSLPQRDKASKVRNPQGRSTANSSEHAPRDLAELPLLDEILWRFSDALALVETAHGALDRAQEDDTPIGAEVLTLHRGIEELKGVYTEFDLTFAYIRRRGDSS